MSKDIDILKRKIDREIRARKSAEELLEQKSLELWESNLKLKKVNDRLDEQVRNRTEILVKNYNRLSAVVSSLDSAVLIENENRKVIFVNNSYCRLFRSNVLPSAYRGVECESFVHVEKLYFDDPNEYVLRVSSIKANRRFKNNTQLKMKDGTIIALGYTPFFNEKEFIGQMWHWQVQSQ